MKDKILKLLGSIRFWIVTLGAVSAFLATVEVSGFQLSDLFNVITIWLGTVAGIGTVDKIVENFKKT